MAEWKQLGSKITPNIDVNSERRLLEKPVFSVLINKYVEGALTADTFIYQTKNFYFRISEEHSKSSIM